MEVDSVWEVGEILFYLQDILGGGGDSVLVNKKTWGNSVRGGGGDFVRIPFNTIVKFCENMVNLCEIKQINGIFKQNEFSIL